MDYLVPVMFAIVTWWLATVVMLYRSTRAREKCRSTMAWCSLIAVAGLLGVILTSTSQAPAAAYLAFLSGLALWAWHEMSYFLGFITGPRPESCPPGLPMRQRFAFGVKASLYHELAIVATAVPLVLITWDEPNQIASWTFLILWWMRWSAKLNIFLGVRNLHPEFWPEHLQYLSTYVRQANMNRLFPLSMLATAVAVTALILQAQTMAPASFGRTGLMLLVTLMVLAAVEHVFLMVKVPDAWLWRFAANLPGRTTAKTLPKSAPGDRPMPELRVAELNPGHRS
jgi:putative photosynthetic complex assembly protein 2